MESSCGTWTLWTKWPSSQTRLAKNTCDLPSKIWRRVYYIHNYIFCDLLEMSNQGRMEFKPVAVTWNWSKCWHFLLPGLQGRLFVQVLARWWTIRRGFGCWIGGRYRLPLWFLRWIWWAKLHRIKSYYEQALVTSSELGNLTSSCHIFSLKV